MRVYLYEGAAGWRAYRSDLPPEAEAEDPTGADVPAVVGCARAARLMSSVTAHGLLAGAR
jgi:hypothetical protein